MPPNTKLHMYHSLPSGLSDADVASKNVTLAKAPAVTDENALRVSLSLVVLCCVVSGCLRVIVVDGHRYLQLATLTHRSLALCRLYSPFTVLLSPMLGVA